MRSLEGMNSHDRYTERVSILIKGAFGVGKTKLCQAFIKALDVLTKADNNNKNSDGTTNKSDIHGGFFGVYTKTIDLKTIMPFASSSETIHLFDVPGVVTIQLIDTVGFDTNISTLPNSMIRDIDGVMLLFSCDLREQSLRGCSVAYSNLKRAPQLSISVINEYKRIERNKMKTKDLSDDGDEDDNHVTKYPLFMLVGTKGDLVCKGDEDLNDIKKKWSSSLMDEVISEEREKSKKENEERKVFSAHQIKTLTMLEENICSRDKYTLIPTQFTSSIRPTKNSGVLKTFLNMVIKVLETRIMLHNDGRDNERYNNNNTIHTTSKTATMDTTNLNQAINNMKLKTNHSNNINNNNNNKNNQSTDRRLRVLVSKVERNAEEKEENEDKTCC